MNLRVIPWLAWIALAAFAAANNLQGAIKPTSETLRVFFIDVEGGQATLFVTPRGESLLIDTGWPDNNGRDADRIVAAARKAGLSKIDYVLITHYHADHAGGIPQLVDRIPVGTFVDHGPNRELDAGITEKDYAEYRRALTSGKYRNLHLMPGDTLPIVGLHTTVVSSDGKLIAAALPGAGSASPTCSRLPALSADLTENARSLGVLIEYGKSRILDLGDLTRDKERELVCPTNKLGKIDVYIVSHHGWDQSSSPQFVAAIHPRLAIMDNGAKKGGSTSVLQTIRSTPGLEALWQIHYSEEGGLANNPLPGFIANPAGEDLGYGLELTIGEDGSINVTNERTGKTQTYRSRDR